MDAISLDAYRKLLERAGIGEGEPLYAAFMTNYETALLAREAVKGGARGLSEEGERELIYRVAENAVHVTGREIERLSRRVSWRDSCLMALVGIALLVGGYFYGYWNRPGFLAQIEALNDVAGIARYCGQHGFTQEGRPACNLPSVWVRGLPK